jgi:hypothetical protein
MAGWSLWPPLEGEGTGVDRSPLRKFPLLVDSERNIVEGLAHPGPVRLVARRFGHLGTSDSSVVDSPLPPPPTSAAVRGAASNTRDSIECRTPHSNYQQRSRLSAEHPTKRGKPFELTCGDHRTCPLTCARSIPNPAPQVLPGESAYRQSRHPGGRYRATLAATEGMAEQMGVVGWVR